MNNPYNPKVHSRRLWMIRIVEDETGDSRYLNENPIIGTYDETVPMADVMGKQNRWARASAHPRKSREGMTHEYKSMRRIHLMRELRLFRFAKSATGSLRRIK